MFYISIENVCLMIFNTLSCASCVSNMRTGIDIIEWYMPAQVFIYFLFSIMFIGKKKATNLKTCYLVIIYIITVVLGMIISSYSSRLLFLRIPVLFIGMLTYFTMRNGGVNCIQLSLYQH